MTTVRTHPHAGRQGDLRPFAVLVALLAAVVAIVVAVMVIGSDDTSGPGARSGVNLGSEHRGLEGTNAAEQADPRNEQF